MLTIITSTLTVTTRLPRQQEVNREPDGEADDQYAHHGRRGIERVEYEVGYLQDYPGSDNVESNRLENAATLQLVDE